MSLRHKSVLLMLLGIFLPSYTHAQFSWPSITTVTPSSAPANNPANFTITISGIGFNDPAHGTSFANGVIPATALLAISVNGPTFGIPCQLLVSGNNGVCTAQLPAAFLLNVSPGQFQLTMDWCNDSCLSPNTTPFAILASVQSDPGPTCPCTSGSPVEVASGNFFYSTRQLHIPGLGPALDLTLTYNSLDTRQRPFGNGWTHQYDQSITLTTHDTQVTAVHARGNGKIDRYIQNGDGSFTSPPFVHSTLIQNFDGSFTLRNKHGLILQFDANGNLTSIIDRNGNTVTLTYDATGFLTAVTDASGRSLQFVPGVNNLVQSLIDPAGRTFQYAYDSFGNLTGITDPLGNTATFQYDSSNRLTALIDPRGNTLTGVSYDNNGRAATLMEGAETYTYTYSPSTQTTTKVDSVGNTYSFVYVNPGSITTRTDSLNNSETSVYDSDLNVTQFTDKNGNATTSTYDNMGNALTITDALGGIRAFAYDPDFNFPLTLTDKLGNTTRFQYDRTGNLIQISDPLNFVTNLQYDSHGQLIKLIDAAGNSTSFEHDAYGNISQIVDPLGDSSSATFDILGRLLTATDAEDHTSQFTYDNDNRLNRTVDAQGGITTNQYDASGNLKKVTLPNGASTTFTYDGLNRLIEITNPLNQSTTFEYDRRSNVSAKTDPIGQQTVFSYDSIDRLLNKTMQGNLVSYTYDNVGNLLNVTDNDSVLGFTFDALNRIVQATTGPMPAQLTTTLRYSFDANGNRLSMTDPKGGVTNYTYDPRSLVAAITNPSGFITSFAYDNLSRRTQMTRSGKVTTEYSYDPASHLLSLVTKSKAENLEFRYSYDRVGNRLTMSDDDGLTSYRYDSKYQLIAANRENDYTRPGDELYSYDSVGNRVSSRLSGASTFDLANRLISDSHFDYAYDANGNLTQKTRRSSGKKTSYSYDAQDRLIKIELPNYSTVTYRYDGLGRRFEKDVNGSITQYVYDGLDILTTNTAKTKVTARYTHGPRIDEVLAIQQGDDTALFETDALGSVVELLAGDHVTDQFDYDSFGRMLSEQSEGNEDDKAARHVDQPFAFQGREFDSESGLYYFRARYYDPQIGRFITEDPIGFAGGQNFYRLVANNPLRFRDPLGLELNDALSDAGGQTAGVGPDAAFVEPGIILDLNKTELDFSNQIIHAQPVSDAAVLQKNQGLQQRIADGIEQSTDLSFLNFPKQLGEWAGNFVFDLLNPGVRQNGPPSCQER